MNHQHQFEFKKVHEVREGRVVVLIYKSNHRPYPRYNIEIRGSSMTEGDDRLFSKLPIRVEGQITMEIEISPATPADLSAAVATAIQWIEADVREETPRINDARLERDMQRANHGKPQTRHTGKTERKKNKGKEVTT